MSKETFQKGDVILVGVTFYVVIGTRGEYIDCICDSANNRYSWEKADIRVHITALQAVEAATYGTPSEINEDDSKMLHSTDREIPVLVIAQALVGLHDGRFDDLKQPAPVMPDHTRESRR
jgi:hypothetical protein